MSRRMCAALLCAAAGLLAGATPAQAKTLDVLILGDSYSSGNGAGNYYDFVCWRSSTAWGERYADMVRAKGITVNVRNNACGAATVTGGITPPIVEQVKAITPETDLVLVTIGGNDVGFANIVVQCFIPFADPNRCRQAVSSGKNAIPRVTQQAIDVMRDARTRLRPGAKVAVMSYPYLASNSSYTLRGLWGAYRSGQGARELGDLGDQAILTAASTINGEFGEEIITFVPSKDLFAGHEPNPDPYRENGASWIYEALLGSIPAFETYHPNPAGQRALAEAAFRAGGPDGDYGVGQ